METTTGRSKNKLDNEAKEDDETGFRYKMWKGNEAIILKVKKDWKEKKRERKKELGADSTY